MVLEETMMPTCITNAQEERDVSVASLPNAYAQTVASENSKEYLSAVRSESLRPCDGLQATQSPK